MTEQPWTRELANMVGGLVKWVALSVVAIVAITLIFVVLASL